MYPVAYLLAGALEAVRFFSNYFYLADNLTDYLTGNGPGSLSHDPETDVASLSVLGSFFPRNLPSEDRGIRCNPYQRFHFGNDVCTCQCFGGDDPEVGV